MSQGASVRLAGGGSLVQALPGSLEAQVNSSITANKFLGGETFRLFFFSSHEPGSREDGNKSLVCNDITLNYYDNENLIILFCSLLHIM